MRVGDGRSNMVSGRDPADMEATDVLRHQSPWPERSRRPGQCCQDPGLPGAQSSHMACHRVGAWQREDVQAQPHRWQRGCAAGAPGPLEGESRGAAWRACRRHPRHPRSRSDGFWIHRLLEKNGIDSHIVEPASIAVSRRHRRAKTDRIDGETLIRTLAAWRRNEPRVCAMVRPPNPEEEDRRRLTRERSTLIKERVQHVNRIKGLLFGQGITDYEPLHRDRRARLETLATGDGRPLPPRLKAEIGRELARIELVCAQIDAVEQQRDALIASMSTDPVEPVSVLLGLKGIGPELGARLWLEALFRRFANRRQVAAYAG